MIKLELASMGYGAEAVISDLSISIPHGKSLLIIGHNGAGKSTLLKSIFGLLPLVKGDAYIRNLNISKTSTREVILAGVRYLGQGRRSFDEISVRTSRQLLTRLYNFPTGALPPDVLPEIPPNRRMGDLSIGQKRLEALYLLAAGQPFLFLLDEPIAGLDVHHTAKLLEWVRQQKSKGVDFVVVEQRFRPLLEICDLTAVFRRGIMTFLGPSEELLDEPKLASVFL